MKDTHNRKKKIAKSKVEIIKKNQIVGNIDKIVK
jgi:hypothetical protein